MTCTDLTATDINVRGAFALTGADFGIGSLLRFAVRQLYLPASSPTGSRMMVYIVGKP